MTATGVYHKHNFLKLKVFRALFKIYPKYASPNEIAEMINVEPEKVRSMFKHYFRYKYVSRRKGRCSISNYIAYKYRIKLLGAQTLMRLEGLYIQDRELNLRKWDRGKVPQKIDSYMGLTRAGYEKMISEGNDMNIISVDCVDIY
ncbi:hypothetical protein [uncultured Methanolobus sp.]|uniref:hypothetical protein n=1 Tax=uncultured Methanolobus sp. TaxID=218300 RepID=UPI0029C7F6A7|nr:hypothetical protein [uncultured Methanolobus sp.]